MRLRDKRLGESLAWIVDSLLQDESESANAQKIKLQKQEAVESLSYVRDVLMLNEMTLDNDRLIGGEERTRRKQKAQKEAEELQAASALAVVAPPIPVPVVDSHFTHSSPYRMRPQSPPRAASMHSQSASEVRVGQRAPWNYTRSNFSTPTSAVPTALLPRPPPPTSTSLRREPPKSRDQTPTQTQNYQDPLGALP
jgi:TBC1 domain family protein 5